MINDVFKIVSFYDKIRWSSSSNYNLINFFKDDLDDDTKLLTHWLCYITDRQMPFQRIWDLGGFVFSELINEYKKNGSSVLYLDNKLPFIVKEGEGYKFQSRTQVGSNERLKGYGLKTNEKVQFIPRFYSADYFSILFTLEYLDNKYYNRSISRFIAVQINLHKDKSDLIGRILFSLYVLSYKDISQPKKEDIGNTEDNKKKSEHRLEDTKQILSERFEEEYSKFIKDKIYVQKRAWCALRDYFKSPELKGCFLDSLKREGLNEEIISSLFGYQNMSQFELPGDVWNNNTKFRNCILKGTETLGPTSYLNKILREYYNKNKVHLENCSPEQFDISFDFVPRMCQKNNCDICPIGLMKGEIGNNFLKTCVKNKDSFCTVALIDCNYKVECYGNECYLLKLLEHDNMSTNE